ncbi:MAG TPA: DUF1697 domain-containing protein [Nocardioidaceae bacterium]|jgi:uncharacterized protein (DUF1697 family)
MPSYIAFLRAVNVGGRMVKMATLRERLVDAGFTEVETFIASGNVKVTTRLRSTTKVENALEAVMADWLDFEVPTLVRTPAQLSELYDAGARLSSPLSGRARHYVAFLRDGPSASNVKRLESWEEPREAATVVGREVHLWLGSERPKLTNARMEKILDTVATARDWKTVAKLASAWV